MKKNVLRNLTLAATALLFGKDQPSPHVTPVVVQPIQVASDISGSTNPTSSTSTTTSSTVADSTTTTSSTVVPSTVAQLPDISVAPTTIPSHANTTTSSTSTTLPKLQDNLNVQVEKSVIQLESLSENLLNAFKEGLENDLDIDSHKRYLKAFIGGYEQTYPGADDAQKARLDAAKTKLSDSDTYFKEVVDQLASQTTPFVIE